MSVMSGAAEPATPARRRALNTVVTVGVTLGIIAAELVLLMWVYNRATPVRDERLGATMVAGQLLGDRSGADVSIDGLAADLTREGISAGRTRSLVAQLQATDSDGDGEVPATVASDAVQHLCADLASSQRSYDRQAFAIYVLLLLGASLGWAVWFRRLVARHKSLQRQVTEHQATQRGEQRLSALLANATDLTLVCDAEDRTIGFASPAARTLLGREPDDVVGTSVLALLDESDAELFLTALEALQPDQDDTVTVRMGTRRGRPLRTEMTLSDLRGDDAVGGVVLTVRDVTTRWELERQLSHDALHDALTGLGNRRMFQDRLLHALSRPQRADRTDIVVYLDLDDFKVVNDVQGHAVGDQLLQLVGHRLEACSRNGDTVARLGGDEFAILVEDSTAVEAELFARWLLTSLAEPALVGGSEIVVRASIGLASASSDSGDADDVLRNADIAMYRAKRLGPGRIAHYEAGLHVEELARVTLRRELEHGIADGELVLHYQPITSLVDSRLVGVEALVRWNHPTRGLLPPLTFVPLAEEAGLIRALGSWVLRHAIAEIGQLDAPGDPYVSVNVAARQLSDHQFVDEVREVLASSDMAPSRLVLEVTESSLVQDVDQARVVLSALRETGVTVAVDDFGTGYSSLSYLANLPIDILKMDKSFVDWVVTDPRDAQLAAAIIAMGHSLGMATTAEGVETAAQAEWLRSVGCGCGQGYLWSRPVPLAEIRTQLRPGGALAATG